MLAPSEEEFHLAVRRKLINTILPRIEGGKQLRRRFDSVVYGVHSWSTEIALVLGGTGLGHPLFVALFGRDSGAQGGTADSSLLHDLGGYPPWVAVAAGALLIFGVALRAAVGARGLAEKGPLLANCARELLALEDRLHVALNQRNPLPSLDELSRDAFDIAARYRPNGVYPWALGPDDTESHDSIKRVADDLVARYCDGWSLHEVQA